MRLPFAIQDYRRADLPSAELVNCYVEDASAQPDRVVLLPRPALVSYMTTGSGPCRGMFQRPGTLGGDLFIVSGNSLYRGSNLVGFVGGSQRVQMAATDGALLIATESAFYRYDGMSLSTIAFPDDANVQSVAYLGGYAIAAKAGSRRFYFTLDPTTWDGLDYLSAEQSTDPIVGVIVVIDQLWVLCQRHTEIFFLTGDPDAPFQRVQGRVYEKGALSRDSIVLFDNTVAWVGHDGVLYRGDNAPVRLSHHGIEQALKESVASDVSTWVYPWCGHLFLVLHMTNATRVYDAATKQFYSAESFGLPRWRAALGILSGRDILAGDASDGTIWRLTDDVFTDAGAPITRIFTSILADRARLDNVMLDMSTGQRPTPDDPEGIAELRISRDGGTTWGEWKQTGLGNLGQSRHRPHFKRLGMADQDVTLMQFRVTDPVPSRLSAIRLNEPLGGRSRA